MTYLLLFRPLSPNLLMMRQPLKPEREPLPGIAAAACRTGADKDLVKGDIPVVLVSKITKCFSIGS